MRNKKLEKQIKKYRLEIYNLTHSPKAKYGTGIKGFVNILTSPMTVFALLLGIAVAGIYVYKYDGETVYCGIGMGCACVYYAFMHKLIPSSIALITAFIPFNIIGLFPYAFKYLNGDRSDNVVGILLNGLLMFAAEGLSAAVLILLHRRTKYGARLGLRRENGKTIITDTALFGMLPLEGIETLIKTEYSIIGDMPKTGTYRLLFEYFFKRGFYNVATVLTADKTLVLYTLTGDTETLCDMPKSLAASFKQKDKTVIKKDFIQIIEDETMPSDNMLFEAYNQAVVRDMEMRKIDTSAIHKVVYFVSFKSTEKINDFIKAISSGGEFSRFAADGADEYETVTSCGQTRYGIAVTNETRLGVERININTNTVIDTAKTYEGKLTGWRLAD